MVRPVRLQASYRGAPGQAEGGGPIRVAIHADAAAHSVPGGVGVYVRRLVAELARSGAADMALIVSRAATPPPEWAAHLLLRPALPVPYLYAAWNYLGRPRVDGAAEVVHATGLAVPPMAGAALVSTVHDLAVEHMPEVVPQGWRQIYRRGLRRALRQSRVICAVSAATRDELLADYGVAEDRVVITPEAPNVTPATPRDESYLQRLGLRGPYILNVSTIEPRKNQVTLVQAFAAANQDLPDHQLVLAGTPGWGQREVDEAIDRTGMRHRVVLTGRLADAELASLYAHARVFALPSRYEGFGIPLVEAMSFGLPCVTASTPALAELAGEAAVIVDPEDADALAAALVRLTTDETQREELARAGRERASLYTWAEMARLTVGAYQRAAQ